MQDKYASEIKHMLSVLSQIAILIDDNTQNIKDCKNILDEIYKSLNVNRPLSIREKILLFLGKWRKLGSIWM
jgi:hypothetical protein